MASAGREDPEPPGHSGRLLLRMPQTLHAELARAADREGVSLNTFITGALAGAVQWRRPPDPEAEPPPAARPNRRLWLALGVNLALVAIAALTAIALLVTAWR
jgi:hypothetical protein